jgi:hypothetical protein
MAMAGLEAASFDESILEKPRRHGMDDCFFVWHKGKGRATGVRWAHACNALAAPSTAVGITSELLLL